jgi:hypothetical protein
LKYIAHRGLFNGPDATKENTVEQIELAISKGYECEIDLWVIDQKLYLGHDNPQHEVNGEWLVNKPLWIHAKNIQALYWLNIVQIDFVYFWHEEDRYALTSNGYIWTYPGKALTNRSIQVMPETADPELKNISNEVYGICSDYIDNIKTRLTLP